MLQQFSVQGAGFEFTVNSAIFPQHQSGSLSLMRPIWCVRANGNALGPAEASLPLAISGMITV